VRAALTLGVAASVAANVLHAERNPISQAIAAWPPLALLLTVELISRVPMHRRSLAFARLAATAAIAGIAAWVSYWHMAGVASRYGETGASPFLLPLSVDGLIIVASVCLVELAGRIRISEDHDIEAKALTAAVPAPPPAPVPPPTPAPPPSRAPQPVPAREPVGMQMPQLASVPLNGGTLNGTTLNGTTLNGATFNSLAASARNGAQPLRSAPDRDESGAARRQRRPVAETAALAAEIEAKHPELSQAELAARLGISTKRLQAIRRETRELQPAA
jgi:hypothetical protein